MAFIQQAEAAEAEWISSCGDLHPAGRGSRSRVDQQLGWPSSSRQRQQKQWGLAAVVAFIQQAEAAEAEWISSCGDLHPAGRGSRSRVDQQLGWPSSSRQRQQKQWGLAAGVAFIQQAEAAEAEWISSCGDLHPAGRGSRSRVDQQLGWPSSSRQRQQKQWGLAAGVAFIQQAEAAEAVGISSWSGLHPAGRGSRSRVDQQLGWPSYLCCVDYCFIFLFQTFIEIELRKC